MNKIPTDKDVHIITSMAVDFLAQQVSTLTGAKQEEIIDNALSICTEIYIMQGMFGELVAKEPENKDNQDKKIELKSILRILN